MADPVDTIELLSGSIDALEECLEPLFQKTLSQTEENLDLAQKAKLQVLLSYVIQDLVLIFLKTKGIDHSRHPVGEELKRVKAYFDKIKEAEDPATRGLVVDRAAANRFIRAAISEARASTADAQASATQIGTHTRFSHVAPSAPAETTPRFPAVEDIEDESSSSSEDDLQVIDTAPASHKGKGKATEATPLEPSSSAGKRRRTMDPFAGYSADGSETVPTQDGTRLSSNGSRKRHKHQKSKSTPSR